LTEPEYVFKHALTHEVAYESLPLKRRRKLHERTGRAMEMLYPDRLEDLCELLAHHYSNSEDLEKAYRYLRMSGEKASRSSSNWEAFRLCRHALNVLRRFPDTVENRNENVEIRLLMAGPMRLVAYPEDSLEILEEGASIAQQLGDDRSLAKFTSLIGACHSFRGKPRLGMEYCASTFDIALKVKDVDLVAPSAIDLCHSHFMTGDYARVLKVAPKAIALIEKTGRETEFFGRPLNVYSALLVHHGHASGIVGDFLRGEALCEKALDFARSIGSQYSVGFVALVYGMLLGHKGDGERALEQFRDACRHLEETQAVIILGLAWTGRGWGHFLLGDPQTSLQHAVKGLQIQRDTGIPFFQSLHHWRIGEANLDLMDLEGARRCAEEAVELARQHNEKWAEGASRILLGRVLTKAGSGQGKSAERQICQGIKMMERLGLRVYASQGYLWLSELYASRGERELALETLHKAEASFEEMGTDYWLRKTRDALAESKC
jgi:tetratricopeptide (TPR) repeat protein